MELRSLINKIMQIAHDAGMVIMHIYNDYEDFSIQKKLDQSPLTIADQRANDIIVKQLHDLALGYPIVSEENKAIPFTERAQFNRFWMVDPLDGTKEFIKRNGEFTVNIALIENGKPILGVVYAPALDRMYWAAKDEGAFKVENGTDVPIRASQFDISENGLRIVCSRSHMNDETKAFVEQLKNPKLVPTGSSLKIVFLAEGKADIYPRLGPTMEWDIAAAQIILEEAGGKLLKANNLNHLNYNKADLLNPHFIAFGEGDITTLVAAPISG